jgi:hypothetical protein
MNLRKLFKYPTVVDLGWAKSNALEMRSFSPDTEKKCWEDYTEYLKENFPIRYFFSDTLPSFFKKLIWYKLDHAWYFIVSHVVPSRRFHVLDLRQPKNHSDSYRWGWIDRSEAILYANFNLLRDYVEKEDDKLLGPDEEFLLPETSEHFYPVDAEWNKARLEMKRLYFWWMKTRQEKIAEHNKLLHEWSEAHRLPGNRKQADVLFKKYNKHDKDFDKETEANLIKLIKLRQYFWT